MFTGIITDIGTVSAVTTVDQGKRFRISTSYDPAGIDIGASIAHDGVCLTVTSKSEGNDRWYEVEAWEEALRLTTANAWQNGTRLNLERALKVGDEMGGHMVSGHVDGTANIVELTPEGEATRFRVQAPDDLAPFVVPKGSVALNGTSLTVNGVNGALFDVLLIRHSLQVTTWDAAQTGDRVNLEVDTIARHVARYAEHLIQKP